MSSEKDGVTDQEITMKTHTPYGDDAASTGIVAATAECDTNENTPDRPVVALGAGEQSRASLTSPPTSLPVPPFTRASSTPAQVDNLPAQADSALAQADTPPAQAMSRRFGLDRKLKEPIEKGFDEVNDTTIADDVTADEPGDFPCSQPSPVGGLEHSVNFLTSPAASLSDSSLAKLKLEDKNAVDTTVVNRSVNPSAGPASPLGEDTKAIETAGSCKPGILTHTSAVSLERGKQLEEPLCSSRGSLPNTALTASCFPAVSSPGEPQDGLMQLAEVAANNLQGMTTAKCTARKIIAPIEAVGLTGDWPPAANSLSFPHAQTKHGMKRRAEDALDTIDEAEDEDEEAGLQKKQSLKPAGHGIKIKRTKTRFAPRRSGYRR